MSDSPRREDFISYLSGLTSVLPPPPYLREEQYWVRLATGSGTIPEKPITRMEQLLDYYLTHGGGGDITVEPFSTDKNGDFTAPAGKAYSPLHIAVLIPASQDELDSIAEGIGVATPSTPASIESAVDGLIADANAATGEADETLTYAVASLIDAMPSGSISITENGSVDVAQYASAVVNVPSGETFPTYTASVACEVMSEVSAWVRTLGLTTGILVAKNALPDVNQVYVGGAVHNGVDITGLRIKNGSLSDVIINDSRYGGIIHIGTEFIFIEVGVQ